MSITMKPVVQCSAVEYHRTVDSCLILHVICKVFDVECVDGPGS